MQLKKIVLVASIVFSAGGGACVSVPEKIYGKPLPDNVITPQPKSGETYQVGRLYRVKWTKAGGYEVDQVVCEADFKNNELKIIEDRAAGSSTDILSDDSILDEINIRVGLEKEISNTPMKFQIKLGIPQKKLVAHGYSRRDLQSDSEDAAELIDAAYVYKNVNENCRKNVIDNKAKTGPESGVYLVVSKTDSPEVKSAWVVNVTGSIGSGDKTVSQTFDKYVVRDAVNSTFILQLEPVGKLTQSVADMAKSKQ